MLAKERRDLICENIRKTGSAETAILAEMFDVSIETIRKDLLVLEKEDKLQKTHGGAVSKCEMKPMYTLAKRHEEHFQEKRALVAKAMEFVKDGDIIGIDEGSTAIVFAEALKNRFSDLTVVTYSLDVFHTLMDHKDYRLILCGGTYMENERAFYGGQTLKMLSNLHIQKAFVFPTALSLFDGMWGYGEELIQLQDRLIRSSDMTFILADSSKYEKKALLKLCDLETHFCYITDHNLDDKIKKLYAEHNINIHIGGNIE